MLYYVLNKILINLFENGNFTIKNFKFLYKNNKKTIN